MSPLRDDDLVSSALRALRQLLDDIASRDAARAWERTRSTFLPPPAKDVAASRANTRRTWIQGQLSKLEGKQLPAMELLEQPPDFETGAPEPMTNIPHQCGQLARLRWEVKSDACLLLGRLVDVVLHVQRRTAPAGSQPYAAATDFPLVRLEFVERWKRDGLFPWRAVIETGRPEIYVQDLTSVRDWLGVAVDFMAPREIISYDACQVGGGLEGVVGGLMQGTATYGVTCSHVLSSGCSSVVVRGGGADGLNEPDAALIDQATPCFRIPRDGRRVVLNPATRQHIDGWIDNRTNVRRLKPRSTGCAGFVHNQVGCVPPGPGRKTCRFPHLEIKPDVSDVLFGLLPTPLFNRHFSQPGDSGSWVADPVDVWLGMVVAGDGYGGTYVVEAAPLLEYFELRLAHSAPTAPLTKLTPFIHL